MKWTLEKKKIKEIYEYAKNPRYLDKHNASHLHESIKKFGQCEPLVINTDGTLIGGHQRLRTLKKMGYKEVDVYIPDLALTDKEVEELNIRLNKNTGNFDYDILANMWDPLDLIEYGFTQEELGIEDIQTNEDDKEEKKESQMSSITIYFADSDHLQEAENRIATIVDEYNGARYKVRIK